MAAFFIVFLFAIHLLLVGGKAKGEYFEFFKW